MFVLDCGDERRRPDRECQAEHSGPEIGALQTSLLSESSCCQRGRPARENAIAEVGLESVGAAGLSIRIGSNASPARVAQGGRGGPPTGSSLDG